MRLSTPNASYNGLPTDCKDDIRTNLLKEQCHICAYCMRRITEQTTRIEHYIPQSVDESLALNYSNMLGVCPGALLGQRVCENHRDNNPLTVNPLLSSSVGKIQYSRDGSINSSDADINRDLNETLNLNAGLLKENRKSALKALEQELRKNKEKGEWKLIAQRYIKKLNENGIKREYCGFLLYFLYKKTK